MGARVGGRKRALRAALLTSALIAGPPAPALADDATWVGGAPAPANSDYGTAANWSGGGARPPDGIATFGASANSNISLTNFSTVVGGWTFSPAAPAYTVTTDFNSSIQFTGPGITVNGGSVAIANNGGLTFSNSSTAGSAVITNNATVEFLDTSTAGNATIRNGNSLQFRDNANAGNAAIINTNPNGFVDFRDTSGPNGDNKITVGSISGPGYFAIGNNELIVGSNNLSTDVTGDVHQCGPGGGCRTRLGSLTKVGTGRLALWGSNGWSGPTTVNGGTLAIEGTLNQTSIVTVNTGAALAGGGIIDSDIVVNAGGTLAPGSATTGSFMTMTSLAMQSGAQYLVQLNSTTASYAIVTGTATLGGAAVRAVFDPGSYLQRRYTILTAGSVSGTFDNAVLTTNLPGNVHPELHYDATHAYLDLVLSSFVAPPGGLSRNQQNAGSAIVGFFNSNGSIPFVFSALNAAGLTQVSGESATGSQQATFDAMSQFLGVITDPFIGERNNAGASQLASGFADEEDRLPYASTGKPRGQREREAFAAVYRKKPAPAEFFAQRWSVWAAGFGGTQRTGSDAAIGSNSTTSRIGAVAVGADYRFSPDTVAGFALAGGGTNFTVNNLGSGQSDLFQAGIFLRHTAGPAYLAAAGAYGWQNASTDRTVTIAGLDRLHAQFNTNAWSGRVEGGYRFPLTPEGRAGIAPYVAGQFTTFELPAYAEQAVAGANTFALAYGARSVTASRSEFGLRGDSARMLAETAILTLRGRLAWAHDFNTERSLAATFQTLPGASFVVFGAAQSPDKALATAAAELKWRGGFSLAGTFEGEFARNASSYAGKGVARVTW